MPVIPLKAAVEELAPCQVDICQLEMLQDRELVDLVERAGSLIYWNVSSTY